MIISEIINAILLIIYSVFILFYVSRKVSERFGTYVARKAIYLLSAGVNVLLARAFSDWHAPLILGSVMVAFTLVGHVRTPYNWFKSGITTLTFISQWHAPCFWLPSGITMFG